MQAPAFEQFTFIVRHCGERTTEACVQLLQELAPGRVIHRVSSRPFREALRQSLELGLVEGRPWTLCIDADVLVLPELAAFLSAADGLPGDLFEAQALVLDKLIPARRPAGNHLYRTELIARALPLVPAGQSLRPESDMILAMAAKGFRAHQSSLVVGLHDFEQSHHDVYLKALLHGHKHRFIEPLLRRYWLALSRDDDDFRVGVQALDHAVGGGPAQISRDFGAEQARQALAALQLVPKAPLKPPSMAHVCTMLHAATAVPEGETQALRDHIQAKIDAVIFPADSTERTASARQPVIVFVGHDAGRTGAPMSLLGIVQWFAANTPYSIEVILKNGGPLVAEYRKHATVHLWSEPYASRWDPRRLLGRALTRLGRGDAWLLPRHQSAIVKRLAGRHVAAVFANTGSTGHILATLKSALRVPVVTRIPELEAFMRRNNANGSVDRVLALSDHVVAVSQAVKENLVQRHAVPPERITVIHGGCAVARRPRGAGRLREKLGIGPDAFVVGGCGTMDWRKGIDLFIQAANHVAKSPEGAGIYFCWIGGPVSWESHLELHYEIELHSLGERLFFLGEVPDPAPYLADLDLFLLTSREDPFPLAMLEAARQGLPVVCFEGSGGAAEFVDDTVGVTVAMLDLSAMTQAVKDLRQAPGRRAALGKAAHEKSLRYTPERMGEAIFGVLKSVMKKS
jgi:glycosyltransferase involved in cell wall biosynthesis